MDIETLIRTIGYFGLFAIVFAESGLFFGFFLPGDSLLVTAGLLASEGYFDIKFLIFLLVIAAILGDSMGYWMGRRFGKSIFNRNKSLFFDRKHVDRAHAFYAKYGGKALILARFVPVVRTFAPIVAGVGSMEYKKFLTFNIVGAIGWATGMLLLGYFLGNVIPGVDRYLFPIIILIVLVSLLPAFLEGFKSRKGKIFAKFMDITAKSPFKF